MCLRLSEPELDPRNPRNQPPENSAEKAKKLAGDALSAALAQLVVSEPDEDITELSYSIKRFSIDDGISGAMDIDEEDDESEDEDAPDEEEVRVFFYSFQ